MKGLNGKKGLIAIALLMAAMIGLPFAAQYYTWHTTYSIIPLTSDIASIDIPATSGATSKTGLDITPTSAPTITTQKDGTTVYFMVSGTYGAQLAGDYYSLTLHFALSSSAGTAALVLVTTGSWAPGGAGDASGSVTVASAGSYTVTVTVDYWTGALGTATGTKSFVVDIYAVE